MRRMYQEFYLKSPTASYYLRGGYRTEDFQRVASKLRVLISTSFRTLCPGRGDLALR